MNNEQSPKPFIETLAPALKWVERIATAAFIASLVTVFLAASSSGSASMEIARHVFLVASVVLAATYFLNAFIPLNIVADENEKFGMKELLTLMIVPKVLWISSAACMMGFFVLALNLEHNNHLQLWFSGGLAMFVALIILAFSMATGDKHARVIGPIAFRAVPLLILVGYFYINS